jgi:hypothetical protein
MFKHFGDRSAQKALCLGIILADVPKLFGFKGEFQTRYTFNAPTF